MAISRLNGKQIRPGVLTNQHVANDAGIHESKLDVNWSSHYAEALETKKVVDFVQVENKEVAGLSEFNLSQTGILESGAPIALSIGTDEGVITDAPYNKVPMRDAVSGDSFVGPEGQEVYGRMVHDGVDFKVLFVYEDVDAEVPFTMPGEATVDFQYMERFNLRTISELFAANEKFVAGSADITAFQNIHQLARDIYGSGYVLGRDGKGKLEVSLAQQISDEVQARTEAISKLKEDLVSQEAGKGASLIGIEDLANIFTAVTVEGALKELNDKIVAAANGGSTTQEEVDAARISEVTGEHATLDARLEADIAELISRLTTETQRAEAAEQANTQAIADEKARAEAAEQANAQAIADEAARAALAEQGLQDALDAEVTRATQAEAALTQSLADEAARAAAAEEALADRATDLEAEVQAARGSEASIDVRLDRALNENGTLKAGQLIHEHFRARFQAVGGEAEVLLTQFTSKKTLPAAFQVGDDSLEVYINGQLQEEGLNYQEALTGDKITFDLGDGTVLEPTDIVQIKFHINNAE